MSEWVNSDARPRRTTGRRGAAAAARAAPGLRDAADEENPAEGAPTLPSRGPARVNTAARQCNLQSPAAQVVAGFDWERDVAGYEDIR